MLLAITCFLIGVVSVGGSIAKFHDFFPSGQPLQTPGLFLRYISIALIGFFAFLAAAGLIVRKRIGWWLSVLFCFAMLSTFVIVSSIHVGIQSQLISLLVRTGVIVLVLVYLQTDQVLRFFRFTRAPSLLHQSIAFLTVLITFLFLGKG